MKNKILKKLAVIGILILLSIPTNTNAQDNVGIGTPSPDASAILELLSVNKGMLVPRMNTAGMTAIPAPANSYFIKYQLKAYLTQIQCVIAFIDCHQLLGFLYVQEDLEVQELRVRQEHLVLLEQPVWLVPLELLVLMERLVL